MVVQILRWIYLGVGWEDALQPVIQTKAEELSHIGSDKPVLGRVSITEPGVQSVDWLPAGPMLSPKVWDRVDLTYNPWSEKDKMDVGCQQRGHTHEEMNCPGTSPGAQWLRLHAPNAGDPASIPGQVTRSHIPKSSHASTKDPMCCNKDPA